MVDRLKVLRFELMVKRGLHARSHRHQKEKRSMKHYVGLDVAVKETEAAPNETRSCGSDPRMRDCRPTFKSRLLHPSCTPNPPYKCLDRRSGRRANFYAKGRCQQS